MTVSELIEKLSKLPVDAAVVLNEDGTVPVCGVQTATLHRGFSTETVVWVDC